jgi:anti-sigma factor RsiW
MYVTKLGKGPYPTSDCSAAGLTDSEKLAVQMFLSDIAGIASHGQKLATITAARRAEFEKIAARSFEERWPHTCAKITPERSPRLFRSIKDSEEARSLILRYIAGEFHL